MNYTRIKDFYINQIQDNFLPYWSKFRDNEFGGILNCISNDGKNLLSKDKFTWSQGRWLYILSYIYQINKNNNIFSKISNSEIESWMDETYRFIKEKSIYDDYRCCFVLSQDGEKKKDKRTGRYDASIYADCFALIGMSTYAKAVDKIDEVELIDKLADSIISRLENNDFLTEPYPIPTGYKVHGVPMILINTMQEYILMKEYFAQDASKYIEYARKQVNFILDELYDSKHHIIREHKSSDKNRNKYLIDRHINPGHTIEDAWFWIEHLEKFGNLDERIEQISKICKATFNLGWDSNFDGMLRFVDYEGGQPKGDFIDTPYERLVENTWDMKLWWPHSECLYTTLLMYSKTHDEEFLNQYNRYFDYDFTTFPSKAGEEWDQIRTRDGKPEEKLVALPVKDPFHIMRNFLKIISLTEKEENAKC